MSSTDYCSTGFIQLNFINSVFHCPCMEICLVKCITPGNTHVNMYIHSTMRKTICEGTKEECCRNRQAVFLYRWSFSTVRPKFDEENEFYC